MAWSRRASWVPASDGMSSCVYSCATVVQHWKAGGAATLSEDEAMWAWREANASESDRQPGATPQIASCVAASDNSAGQQEADDDRSVENRRATQQSDGHNMMYRSVYSNSRTRVRRSAALHTRPGWHSLDPASQHAEKRAALRPDCASRFARLTKRAAWVRG